MPSHPKPKPMKNPWGYGWTNNVRLDPREVKLGHIDTRPPRRVR
mgnify:CR=1 FL=1